MFKPNHLKFAGFLLSIILFSLFLKLDLSSKEPVEQPNILWIVSEDNTTFLGCYGDENAVTPNLDTFASESVLFSNTFSNAPVCAPARNTLITGMYANSLGTEHMRSKNKIPAEVKFFTEYLREAGYYCSNGPKEDYNTFKPENAWDESSRNADWQGRAEGQPFFSVRNFNVTHEHIVHKVEPTIHDPEKMRIPPYLPDNEITRHDFAQYYDKITEFDSQFGEIIQKLKEQNLYENTIIFYYADNGGVLPRSKRFLYENGTHVPLMVRFPEKYGYLSDADPGSRSDRLVSFVDFAPTVLSLVGIEPPEYMQGTAFFGNYAQEENSYAFMFRDRMDERYDLERAVRDKRFRYIRNYLPQIVNGQHLEYLWRQPSMKKWHQLFEEGKLNETQSAFFMPKPPEELYDVVNDPDNVQNLADNPKYKEVLLRMRGANTNLLVQINDKGFIPEPEMMRLAEETPIFDYFRENQHYNVAELIEKIDKVQLENSEETVVRLLAGANSIEKFWGLTSCLMNPAKWKTHLSEFEKLLDSGSPNVQIAAAELVLRLKESRKALNALKNNILQQNDMVTVYALNAIDRLGGKAASLLQAVQSIDESYGKYTQRMANYLINAKKQWK